MLDIGGTLGGYASDMTRTIWVTGGARASAPTTSSAASTASSRRPGRGDRRGPPGVTPSDRRRRPRAITDAALRAAFFHRTGHGIGLEGHEEPYLVAGNAEPLAAGMAFSVEPGIYLEGRYGARIEDIVVCGEAGPTSSNQTTRDLLVVAG